MWLSVVSVSVGAAAGGLCRWGLAEWLNGRTGIPLGTLAANLIGGYLVGIAMALISARDSISPQWRLALVTGFLGGLTTFSSFSWEAVTLMRSGQVLLAMGRSPPTSWDRC